MPTLILLLIFLSVAMSAAAQAFLKFGVGTVAIANPVATLVAMLMTPSVVIGLSLYGAGAIAWLFVLQRTPLSLAYPFVALGFVATAVIGAAIFGETLSIARMAGIGLIVVGCVLVSQSA